MKRRSIKRLSVSIQSAVAAVTATSMVTAPLQVAFAQSSAAVTATPIQHIVVIIGENRTFDHVFATYTPKNGVKVNNLLSEGIIKADGTPGPNYALAAQAQAVVTGKYKISPKDKAAYTTLPPAMTDGAPQTASDTDPPPFATLAAASAVESQIHDGIDPVNYPLLTTGATGIANDSIDTRITNAAELPNGPYQITGKTLPYDSYTASPVHRFYQMWQQTDCSMKHATSANPSGCINDLFPWVETSVGTGSNGAVQTPNFTDQTTGEGSASMGFFNMAAGDVPYFKSLADDYTISDNYHQAIMGGTGANHIALGTGLAIYYSDSQGHVATPPSNEIENPNPLEGTNNYYAQDGYSGGSYTNCSDSTQPGVKQISDYLNSMPSKHPLRCQSGAYYLLNNYNPGYLGDGTVNTSTFTIPPSTVPTIGDRLNQANVSWKYYGAGWNNYVKNPTSELGAIYCNICNPFQYETAIMTDATQRTTHLKDVTDLDADVAADNLPAVSIIKPDGLLDGHPASSKLSLFEAFSKHVIDEIKAKPDLWAHTAILITFDEGGGYWDSGYIQPMDYFGDGTRIPAIMVSPYSTGGHVSHTYADHASFLKFVERNWHLPVVSPTGRDNYPNPITTSGNPYAPTNSPAIGDLTDMFTFASSQ